MVKALTACSSCTVDGHKVSATCGLWAPRVTVTLINYKVDNIYKYLCYTVKPLRSGQCRPYSFRILELFGFQNFV